MKMYAFHCGGEKTLRTDCRVVAATNRDLEQMVKDGAFREDLYFRINTITLRVPPLRERTEDLYGATRVHHRGALGDLELEGLCLQAMALQGQA